MWGGAGAFNCRDSARSEGVTLYCAESDGGDTIFGSVVGEGATGVKYIGYTIDYGSGYNLGKYDTCDCWTSGGAGYTLTDINGNTYGAYGSGGNVSGGGSGSGEDITGASGHVKIQLITVNPGQTISYTIGAGGSACKINGYGNDRPTNGNAGAILVEWGKGIQDV